MDEKLTKFLGIVPTANWRGNMPAVWNDQLREALSEGFVTIGFGGLLKLTDSGREAAKQSYRMDDTQAWQS